jgi:hypothetical protein
MKPLVLENRAMPNPLRFNKIAYQPARVVNDGSPAEIIAESRISSNEGEIMRGCGTAWGHILKKAGSRICEAGREISGPLFYVTLSSSSK